VEDLTGQPVWEDGSWDELPPLDGDASCDLCVVGLGGSGLTAVLEGLRRGCTVVGVDADSVGAGGSGRNGGFLMAGLSMFHHRAVEQYGHARALHAYRLTLEELERIAAETPGAVRRTSSHRLPVTDEEVADCEAQYAQMVADGLPAERWDDGPWGPGITFPYDASLQPLKRCRSLARTALRKGARLFEATRVVDVGGGQVATLHGRVRCGATVVAVDGGIDRVLPELGGRVRTARAQMLATAPVRRLPVGSPVYARWGWDYWQQRPDGTLCIGGGRDLGGDAEWTHDTAPTAAVQQHLDGVLAHLVPERPVITHRWAGTIAFTDDGLPVLGEIRRGVWAAGAYSGTGNVVGALCGRAALELALDEPSEIAEVLG
jgi:gamma-glutamylputrescine oxidase